MTLPRPTLFGHARTGRLAVWMLAACLTIGAAACTVQHNGSGPPGSEPASVAATAAPGVTGDSIRIGVVYPDLASVRAFVSLDLGDYEQAYRVLIDRINATGGVHGRKLVPVFGKLDVISPAAAEQTCVHLTQDEQVFAVLGTFPTPDELSCYTQTHPTIVIGGPQTRDMYTQAKAPWFSEQPGGDGTAQVVRALAGQGALGGQHRIAVVAGSQDQGSVSRTLLPALRQAGVVPVATGYVPTYGVDAATAAQQTGVILQRAQAAGADTLLLTGAPVTTLPPLLEKTSWRPRLLFTDTPTAYQLSKGHHDFSVLAGALVASPTTDWTDPALQDCAKTLERADPALTGRLLDPSTVPSGQPTPGVSLWTACLNLRLFTTIADRAGQQLSYGAFQQAGLRLGPIHLPGYADDAHYGPDSTNGSIPVRARVYDPAANRFVPTGS